MLRLLRSTCALFLSSRLRLRGAAVLGVALLLAGGSLASPMGAAHAAECVYYPPVSFVHTATSGNTQGNATALDEDFGDAVDCVAGNPVFVQAKWNAGGVLTFDTHPIGVWFNPGLGWAIENEDGAPMPLGASFNVYMTSEFGAAGSPSASSIFLDTVTTGQYITYLDDPTLNGNPSAQLMVTQDFDINGYMGAPSIANPHQIGIWYDATAGKWTIYNEDRAPIPVGAEFNVMVVNQTGLFPNAFTQGATSSNTSGDSTCINNPLTNQNPSASLFVTHIYHPLKVKPVPYNGYFPDVPGVWYNTSLSEWCVFDGSYNTMPLGAEFSVALP
jgi:hypothetical protein